MVKALTWDYNKSNITNMEYYCSALDCGIQCRWTVKGQNAEILNSAMRTLNMPNPTKMCFAYKSSIECIYTEEFVL